MATPFSGISDQLPDNQVLPVDYSFLNFALGQKESQYEQGVQAVKSVYSSILNSPLTNPQNQEAKQRYLNQSKDGLKELSKADLTDPKNVAQASKIFAPFWQDQDILYDMSKTKQLAAQEQAGLSMRDSKDLKEAELFNPQSLTRLQWARQDLANAKRGDGSIRSIEIPNYIPKLNPNDAMSEYNKANGFKGNKYVTHKDAYMITTTNGVQAIPDYKVRAAGVLGSAFNPQFSQEGYNIFRSEMQAIEKLHPEYDRPTALRELANGKYYELRKGATDEIASHDDFINNLQNHIKDIESSGSLTEEQKRDKRNLEVQLDEHSNYKKTLEDNLNKFDNKYKSGEDLYPQLIKNPEEYYGQIVRNNTIHNMAETLASNRSVEEDINPIWKFQKEQQGAAWDRSLKSQEFQYRQKQDAISNQIAREGIAASLYKKGVVLDPRTGQPTSVGSNISEGIHDAGKSSTTLQNRGTVANVIEDEKNQAINSAINSLISTDPKTGSSVTGVLTRLGLTDDEVTDLNTFIKRRMSPENYNTIINFSGGEQKAWDKAKKALETNLGTKITATSELINSLGKYITNEISNSNVINQPADYKNQLVGAYNGWINVSEAKDKFDLINRQQKELVAREATSKEGKDKYNKLLADNGSRIADASDIAQYAPDIQVHDEQGNVKVITGKELAQAYLSKNIQAQNDYVEVGGRRYTIDKVNGEDNINPSFGDARGIPKYRFNNTWNTLINRFGNYEERDNLNNKLYSKASENFSVLKNATGREGRKFYYDMSKKGEEAGNNELMIVEAMNPANQLSTPEVDGKPVDNESLKYLTSLTASTDAIISNQLQAHYNNVSGTSPRSIEFKIPADDKAPKELQGKIVTVPIAPNASGSFLSKIPINSGIYVWDKMNHGETIKAPEIDKSMGFDYTLTPDDRNHPSVYTLKWSYTKFDPEADPVKYPNHLVKEERRDVINMATNSPDEIRNKISDLRKQSVDYLINSRKDYNTKNSKK